MERKYTEGNWHVVEGGRHWNNPAIENYRIHAATGDRVFDVAWSEIGELVAEHVYEKDDAVLMSASKELLEALKETRRELHSCQAVIHLAGGFDPAYVNGAKAAIASSDAAIAKATGGKE